MLLNLTVNDKSIFEIENKHARIKSSIIYTFIYPVQSWAFSLHDVSYLTKVIHNCLI